MRHGGKPGLMRRRQAALKMLETQLAEFVKAGKDKASYTSTRNGGKRTVVHAGRKYEDEVARLEKEIQHLKEIIS